MHIPNPQAAENLSLGFRGASMLTERLFADYALFHEHALANATRVLQEEGKVLGSSLKAVSIQSF